MSKRTCRACDADISHRSPNALYCSTACRKWVTNGNTGPRVRAVEVCQVCGGSIDAKVITALYCSRKCKNRAVQMRRVRDDSARYQRERDRRIAYATAYAKANPHVGQATKRRRRARLADAGMFQFTSKDWLRVQRRFGGRCAYCGKDARLTMDHVVPIIRGGTHSVGNIVPACMSCNTHKQGRFITEWKHGRSRRAT